MTGQAHRLLRVTALNAVPAAYAPILRLQELLFEQRKNGLIPDTMLQLEHSHVYTMGKRGSSSDFLGDPCELRAGGAEVVTSPRGGETTYHGPGQLVVYPIVSLRELGCGARAYVEGLEDVMVRTLGRYGIAARGRVPGKTGVWVGERKVGAVGVRISQGVASHGVALNVATDLSWFRHIIPCGTADKEATSVHRQLAAHPQQQPRPAPQQQHRQQQEHRQQLWMAPQEQQQQQQQAGRPGTESAVPAVAPSLQQVAADFLDAFSAHFSYTRHERLPDVLQLAADLGLSDGR